MKSQNPPPSAPTRPTEPRPAPLRLRFEAPGHAPFSVVLRGRVAEAVREAARRQGVTPGEAAADILRVGMAAHRGSVPV